MRRLAEDYAEVAAHAERDRVRAEIRADLEARRPAANPQGSRPNPPRRASKSMF